MKIYLYDRQEAIKNGCYKRVVTYEKLKSIGLLVINCILAIALTAFLTIIMGLLTKLYVLSYFGFVIFPIVFFFVMIGVPIIYSKDYNKRTVWLYRAIIKDENNKIWLVEQNILAIAGSSYINEKDEFYKIFKNEKFGTVTELKNLKIQKESKKYYICTYEDLNGNNKTIEIAKAYKNLKEVL